MQGGSHNLSVEDKVAALLPRPVAMGQRMTELAFGLCCCVCISGILFVFAMSFYGAHDRSEWNKGQCVLKRGQASFECLQVNKNGCSVEVRSQPCLRSEFGFMLGFCRAGRLIWPGPCLTPTASRSCQRIHW